MYNNKCIVSGDEPQAEMAFEISGDREYARNFETPEEAEIGAEAVADLLPLKDVASPEAIRTAKKIVNLYLNPKTGDIADKVLSSLIVRGKVDDEAKDAVYATKRVANAVVRKWGDKIGWDKIGAFVRSSPARTKSLLSAKTSTPAFVSVSRTANLRTARLEEAPAPTDSGTTDSGGGASDTPSTDPSTWQTVTAPVVDPSKPRRGAFERPAAGTGRAPRSGATTDSGSGTGTGTTTPTDSGGTSSGGSSGGTTSDSGAAAAAAYSQALSDLRSYGYGSGSGSGGEIVSPDDYSTSEEDDSVSDLRTSPRIEIVDEEEQSPDVEGAPPAPVRPVKDEPDDLIGFHLAMPLEGIYKLGAGVKLSGEETEEWEIAGLFDFVSKVAAKLDPTKKGSITGTLVSAIPGVGPGIMAAANTLASIRAGSKVAANKVQTVQDLARAGVPTAQSALANLKTAQRLGNNLDRSVSSNLYPEAGSWFPFSSWWRTGIKGSVVS